MNYQWNDEKNEKLKKGRGVSFEEVIEAMTSNNLLAIVNNPNRPNQIRIIVKINNYAYCVPAVPGDEYTFLKTIYPDRVSNKKYLKNKKEG